MGIYDEVERQQIKSTPDPGMVSYREGDTIPLPDGIHITLEGAFAVRDGWVLYATKHIYSKWGDVLKASDLLDSYHPLKDMDRGSLLSPGQSAEGAG